MLMMRRNKLSVRRKIDEKQNTRMGRRRMEKMRMRRKEKKKRGKDENRSVRLMCKVFCFFMMIPTPCCCALKSLPPAVLSCRYHRWGPY